MSNGDDDDDDDDDVALKYTETLTAVEMWNVDGDIASLALFRTLRKYTTGLHSISVQVCDTEEESTCAVLFFKSEQDAIAAVKKLDNMKLQNRIIRLRCVKNPLSTVENSEPSGTRKRPKRKRRTKKTKEKKTHLHLNSLISEIISPPSFGTLLFFAAALALSLLLAPSSNNKTGGDSLDRVLLDEAMRVALWSRENIDMYRSMSALEFEYTSDFDSNGVMYHIGTGGRTWPWTNPAATGSVRVSHAPKKWGRNPALALQREGLQLSFTGPNEPSTVESVDGAWYMFDLGETRRIIPTRYTLRCLPRFIDAGGEQRASGGELRHWVFEGSSDLKEWHVLRRHTGHWFGTWGEGDTSIVGGKSFSWHVSQFGSPTRAMPTTRQETLAFERRNIFRYLRIRQIGDNASGEMSKRTALYLNGFEVYGVMLTAH